MFKLCIVFELQVPRSGLRTFLPFNYKYSNGCYWHNSEVFAHFIMLFKLTVILLVPTEQETTYGNSNSYTLE